MAVIVYCLCTITAFTAAWLLLRSYAANKVRLIMWTGLCFAGLTVNNLLVLMDLLVVPQVDLYMLRQLFALGSMSLLVYGLVWESK